MGISTINEPKTKVFVAKGGFLEKVFLAKEVSGRTVQLNEIGESSSSCQSSATPEVVLGFPILTDMEATTCVVETSVEIATEPRGSCRLCTKPTCGLRMKYCCSDNNGPATNKEANDGP